MTTDPRPVDPDLDPELAAGRPGRPTHLRPLHLGLVALGGALGTGARAALTLAAPGNWPLVAVNVAGAFLLGLLLESLARRGPDAGVRLRLRLLAGTGFLGGFTTYSSFATGAAELLGAGRVLAALGIVLVTLAAGAAATLGGIAAGAALQRGAR